MVTLFHFQIMQLNFMVATEEHAGLGLNLMVETSFANCFGFKLFFCGNPDNFWVN
jgi:hypothetical protein